MLTPFHLAIQVGDIAEARAFYGGVLGFSEGRSASHWVDFNAFGHQLVVHLNPAMQRGEGEVRNAVDGHGVPVPHFGVVLQMDTWQALARRLQDAGVAFEIEPYVRFAGLAGEQGTFFFYDPFGNALEFKGFRDIDAELFAT